MGFYHLSYAMLQNLRPFFLSVCGFWVEFFLAVAGAADRKGTCTVFDE